MNRERKIQVVSFQYLTTDGRSQIPSHRRGGPIVHCGHNARNILRLQVGFKRIFIRRLCSYAAADY